MESRLSSAKTCISARDQPLVLTSLLFWVMDTLQPMSGLCFVKPITTAETLSGGSIVLPESYRARVTAQQAEIVAVGPPGRCDELEDCERPHAGDRHLVDPRIVPGAWVLCAKWAYVAIEDKLFAVRHEHILGVFIGSPIVPGAPEHRSHSQPPALAAAQSGRAPRPHRAPRAASPRTTAPAPAPPRSEEHTSELQSHS